MATGCPSCSATSMPTEHRHRWRRCGVLRQRHESRRPGVVDDGRHRARRRRGSPISGGAGLIDLSVRSEQGGVVEALMLRMLGPTMIGERNANGETRIYQLIPNGNHDVRYEVAYRTGHRARQHRAAHQPAHRPGPLRAGDARPRRRPATRATSATTAPATARSTTSASAACAPIAPTRCRTARSAPTAAISPAASDSRSPPIATTRCSSTSTPTTR